MGLKTKTCLQTECLLLTLQHAKRVIMYISVSYLAENTSVGPSLMKLLGVLVVRIVIVQYSENQLKITKSDFATCIHVALCV